MPGLLRRGSSGGQVVWLQRSLVACGYGLGGYGCDGKFGPSTANSVRAFQAANGLAADGIVGDGTWNAIRNRIRPIQNALIARGYGVGGSGADGLYGDGTFNAVRAFQAANGLPADGLAGRNTQAALEAAERREREKTETSVREDGESRATEKRAHSDLEKPEVREVTSTRFIETQRIEDCKDKKSLTCFASFLMKVPEPINFYEALVLSGADAPFIFKKAREVLDRVRENGVMKQYGLTEDEVMVIAGYTAERQEKSMYTRLNNVLRGEHDEEHLESIRPLLVLFLRALRKLPIVEVPEVYRGSSRDLKLEEHFGEFVTWWGFTSTTVNINVTNIFIQNTYGSNLMILKGPCKGYDLTPLSVYQGEQEILLEPETKLKVTGYVSLFGGACVQMEVQPHEPKLLDLAPAKSSSGFFDYIKSWFW